MQVEGNEVKGKSKPDEFVLEHQRLIQFSATNVTPHAWARGEEGKDSSSTIDRCVGNRPQTNRGFVCTRLSKLVRNGVPWGVRKEKR